MGFPNDRVWVQITIETESLTPEQISEHVGTTFDVAHRIGEPRGHMGKYWEVNVWQIRACRRGTEATNACDLIPGCIDELLQRTCGISSGLRRVVASFCGEFAIHVTSTFAPGISLSSDQIRHIADLGLSFDVDIVLTADDE